MSKEFNYSFIIPHKNCPDLLQRCVDSIPERDDVQVIVVDDNSEEGKKPSLKKRKNLQVILLDAEHSKGAGRARNVGLKQAEGKWLLFADADDYYNEGFLGILDKYSSQEIDVLYYNFIYKDGKTEKEALPQFNIQKIIDRYNSTQEDIDNIKFKFKVPWNKMISHNYVIHYHFFFEEVPNGNDMFFSECVGYHADRIDVEKSPIYVYIKNENSIVTSKRTLKDEMCRLEHRIKLNYFYEFIGHAEWKKPFLKDIFRNIHKFGFPFLKAIILTSVHIYMGRREWVKLIPLLNSRA